MTSSQSSSLLALALSCLACNIYKVTAMKFHHYLVRHNHIKLLLVDFFLVLVLGVVLGRFLADPVADSRSALVIVLEDLK